MAEKDLAQLIENVSNSLHAEMQEMARTLEEAETGWAEAADRIENAVGRGSRMITSGTIAIAGLNRSLSRHDKAIKQLQERVRKLERRK